MLLLLVLWWDDAWLAVGQLPLLVLAVVVAPDDDLAAVVGVVAGKVHQQVGALHLHLDVAVH